MGSLMRCQNGTGDDFLRLKVDTGRIPRFGGLTAIHACLVSSTVIFCEILEVEVWSVLHKVCRWWYSSLNSVILYSKHSTSLTMVSWRRDQSLRRRSIRPILTLHTTSLQFFTLSGLSTISSLWSIIRTFALYLDHSPNPTQYPTQYLTSSVVLVSYVKDGLRPFFRPTEV